jgi:hypothetical protein
MRALPHGARSSFVAVAVVAAMCVAHLSSAASRVNGGTINVLYSGSSLQARLSDGTVLASGAVVPPGLYSVVVYDAGDDPNPAFSLTGPEASVSSDLNPSGMQIEVPMTFGPFNLPPSSSYTISDTNMAGGPHITFSTAATGSSASASTTTTTTASPTPSTGPSTPAAAKTLGTLALSVGASGKASLTMGAKPVKTLKAGKYTFFVGDSSKKVGLLIGHGASRPSRLSGGAAVGASLHTLTLTPGKWFVETTTSGPKIYVDVKK